MKIIDQVLKVFNSLKGAGVARFYLREWVWTEQNNITFESDNTFIYADPIYIELINQRLFKIHSVEIDEYSLFIEEIERDQFIQEKSITNNAASFYSLDEYENIRIDRVSINNSEDANSIISVSFYFNNGKKLILYSGDYQENMDGSFRVFSQDEMVLVFFDQEAPKYFDL
jgi:hypothetical protein